MKGCRPLTDQEFDKVVSVIDGRCALRDKLLLIMGVKMGVRITELLSLKVADVYQHGTVPTHISFKRSSVKGKRAGRSIPVHPAVKTALVEFLATNKPSNEAFLFAGRGEAKAISRQQAWNICEQAFSRCHLTGILGTHTMRKTFAKNIYERSGHCLIRTKRALGHTDIRTTEKYLSFTESEVENLILAA